LKNKLELSIIEKQTVVCDQTVTDTNSAPIFTFLIKHESKKAQFEITQVNNRCFRAFSVIFENC